MNLEEIRKYVFSDVQGKRCIQLGYVALLLYREAAQCTNNFTRDKLAELAEFFNHLRLEYREDSS